MPHRTRPLTGLLLFTGINAVLVQTITPVYDFVCFLPYWERRIEVIGAFNYLGAVGYFAERERIRKERESLNSTASAQEATQVSLG